MSTARPTALLVLPTLALAAALLAGCTPGTPTPATPEPSTSASSTPTPEPTEAEETEEEAAAAADAAMRANIIDAVSSGNTAALEGYFAPTVHVTYAASEDEGDVSNPALLVMNVSNATSPTAVWDFNLPASVIDNYRNNPGHYPSYVDDFPEGAIVGRSSEDKVISFAVSGGLITRLFISNTEYALTFA